MGRKALLAELDRVNKELQEYNQVNKKAMDQYVSFTEQYDELLRKKKEADESAEVRTPPPQTHTGTK